VQNIMLNLLRVRKSPGTNTQGILIADGRVIRCALGRSGIGIKRGEGDGITPLGHHQLIEAHIRTDRVPVRASHFALSQITETDGWCDAVGDANYNRLVSLPYPASHEQMKRDDHLYDVVVVMDHNVTQRMSVGGSAIFFHLAHDDYRPTEGCVAISRKDMLWLLPQIGPETVMVVE
jgi:L,D-peptidoglycan transpeptidase YkuD (ErfK/YbiS/YcfS/YnhG family)